MADELQYWLVDAFAHEPYTGNPAGVVLEADALDDKQMSAIAREINASETAFVSRTADLHRPPLVRWFTPQREVQFCGHATLAAAHACHAAGIVKRTVPARHVPEGPTESARPDSASLVFESAAGELVLTLESIAAQTHEQAGEPSCLWWLQMPKPELTPDNTNPMLTAELLGITIDDIDPAVPIMRTRDNDVIIMLKSWNTLIDMRPDFYKLGQWGDRHNIRGFCVATRNTLAKSTDVHSRFFAPSCGINEDPVTGSVHGPLAVLMVINDLIPMAGDHAAVNCVQGEPAGRTGFVRALVQKSADGFRVSIGGCCYVTMQGTLLTPAAT